ncbi:uracil-DNA glycosylase [Aquibacillus halophilus]|uniref:Uracil-DNA glycosylase n=1 Tax=Aquibacillus halophilus TaxID=930132 RepID=A0A6A8DFD3_9BACI|nr:uracil-DNA glycosylase [Aquibacillus halophilus]MRH44418.1 uracil-DNA glycosylase [Aquibacillus halophilus]
MLIPGNTHPSWNDFLTMDIRNELKKIEKQIGENFNPTNPANILRFLTIDLNNIKVIWLGQDVYPAKGVATGRSFEVGGLVSWDQSFRQVSIKNIIRLLHKNYFGITSYDHIRSFNTIKIDINDGIFPIKSPDEWFSSLEKQGVLFLNTSFTCEIGKANSHKHIWEEFSEQVVTYISKHRPDVKWFLWGNEAKTTKQYIPKGVFFESRHPMMCSKKYENDFLKSNCFLLTTDEIDWLG